MGITMIRAQAQGLTRDQRNAFLASWLGWAMDAFDYVAQLVRDPGVEAADLVG